MTDFATALWLLWPNGDQVIPGLRKGIIDSAPAVCDKYGIRSPQVFAHIMAQCSHECGAGHEVVENLNYSAQRLIQVWPRHFSAANAPLYAYNPEKLANFIYNPPQHNDLGNRAGTTDGWDFRGRGATQVTGRAEYELLASKTGLDLLNNPDIVNEPDHFLECGVADFILCGCMPYAIAGDFTGETVKLNGGTTGLVLRQQWLDKWKRQSVPIPMTATVIHHDFQS